jgi:hypothetical protein
MKIYARTRQAGKTTELVRLAAGEFLYVVCADHEQVRYVARLAQAMGLDIPMPITWREFTEGTYYGKGIKGFVIDNLDLCIQQMTTVTIKAVSLTDADATVPTQAP